MPLMDEFQEERDKIKTAPFKVKWKYFVDYYLKWVIGIGITLAIIIAVVVTTLTHKDEMLYVSMPNFTQMPTVDKELLEPFIQQHLENPKKQDITVDSSCFILGDTEALSDPDIAALYPYEDDQKVAMVLMVGQMDLMISGEDVIDRFTGSGYVKPLSDVYTEDELKAFDEQGLVKYLDEVPVALCMDDAKILNKYYQYSGVKVDHIYAAYTYGKHTDLAKLFLEQLW